MGNEKEQCKSIGKIIDEVLENPKIMMKQCNKVLIQAKEEAERLTDKNKELEKEINEKNKQLEYLKGKIAGMEYIIEHLDLKRRYIILEIKTGGRGNGQTIYNAIKFLEYLETLEVGKMYGVQRLSKNITILTKEEAISKEIIKRKIKELEDEGYWDFYETVDLEKTIEILKELL